MEGRDSFSFNSVKELSLFGKFSKNNGSQKDL